MKRLLADFIFIVLITVFLSSCAPAANPDAFVDLNNLSLLPTPMENEVIPLKVAIAAVISPQGSAESYQLLLEYLSSELDRPVEAVQRRTYMEVNDLIQSGEIDLAFVCTSSYLVGRRDFGMQLLAAPMVHGEAAYRAQIIVPADSSANELSDLRGTVFAFTDPISFSGRVYPTYLLQQMGEIPESFFQRTFFTYSHDDAIQAVASGVADGASVDSLVLDFAIERNPEIASQIQIIHTSKTFGIPPVVVNPDIRPQLRGQLEDLLLTMGETTQGVAALQALGYDRFVQIDDEAYTSAYDIQTQTKLPSVTLP